MRKNNSMLHFICGKLGSGKTTLAKQIATETLAVFISEDIWLATLYPDEVNSLQDYLLYSKRIRKIIYNLAVELLTNNISVVFDFGGNTLQDRAWVKSIIEQAGAKHVLHYIIASDELCKQQFKKRNLDLPVGSKFITDEEFNTVNFYFSPPSENEGFIVQQHQQIE